MSLKERHARNLTIMLTAGGAPKLPEILELARVQHLRAVHVQQLAVPMDEQPAQRMLVDALKVDG